MIVLFLICSLHKAVMPSPKKGTLVTVFIHGTILPVPSWKSLKHVFKYGRKRATSGYQAYIDSLRFNSFLRHQPMGTSGLVKIEKDNSGRHTRATFITKDLFESIYAQQLADTFSAFSYYTFSWNGRLSRRHRKQSGFKLYDELIALKKEIESTTGEPVAFDLYCHSHGGNVALNLAQAEEDKKQGLSVKHLVLLGTPIQKETAHYCGSEVFKSVYNVYSRGDGVQIVDMLSTCTFGSYRRFDVCNKNMPSLPFVKHIECSIGKLKPTHAELWLYKGAGNFVSRSYLDIHPIPVFAHLAHLVYKCDKYPENDLSLTICKKKSNFSYKLEVVKKDHEKKDLFEVELPLNMFNRFASRL